MPNQSGSYSTAQLAAILSEINNDPELLGIAAYLANGDAANVCIMLNSLRDGVTPSPNNNVIGPSGAITGATNATPIVIASANHGRATGDSVVISNVGGNTNANNTPANPAWVITVVDANHFSLNTSAGNAAYTSGGTWAWCISQVAGAAILTPTASSFAIMNAMLKADVAAATPNAAQCAWLNALFTATPDKVQLAVGGVENNIMGNLKGFVGGASTSAANLAALKFRFGSRGEQVVGVANFNSPGQALQPLDIVAAQVGHY